MSDERPANSLPTDPPCPKCKRRYARKFFKAHAQKASFHCDPSRPIGGCGLVWSEK